MVAQTGFYVRYCKFISRWYMLKLLGKSIQSKKLSGIATYLTEKFPLLPTEIMAACIGTFLFFYIPSVLLLLPLNLIAGVVIPIFLSYFAAYSVFNYPLAQYKRFQRVLLQYSDLAFQDLILILNTTHSIFDAIQFLSSAHYPAISEKFSQIFFEITFFRRDPETLINRVIKNLPPGELKTRLLTIVATNFQSDKLIKQMETLAGEKKLEYSTATQQLEDKLLILVAICFLLPMVFGLFLSFLGFAGNYISLILIPFFIGAIHKIKDRIVRNQFELFGEKGVLDKDELGGDDSEMIEYLKFLTVLGNELKRKAPQEIALFNAFNAYHGTLREPIAQCISDIFIGGDSFEEGWGKLKGALLDTQVHFLMNLISRMVEKSSVEAGERIISTLQQLKVNRELIRERESIVKSQQFKIKFLVFIMAGAIGLIAGLTPMLIQIGYLITLPETQVEINFLDSFPITLMLCVIITYSGYFMSKLVKIQNPIRFAIWAFLTFLVLCYISSSLVG